MILSFGLSVGRADLQQWLPYRYHHQAEEMVSAIRSQRLDLIHTVPEGATFPDFVSDQPILAKWNTPMVLTTDSAGQFICPGLPEGEHQLILASVNEGTAAWAALPVDFNVSATHPPEEVRITLEKGGLVEFTVHEYGTDQLPEGIRVSAYGDAGRGESKTDRLGKAMLRLARGEYSASASAQGYDYWRANQRIVVRDGETSRVEAIMDKDPSMSGTVTDAAGKPVSQAQVTIHPFGDHVLSDGQGGFVAGYDKDRADKGVYAFARAPSLALANVVLCEDLEKPQEVALEPALTVTGSIVVS